MPGAPRLSGRAPCHTGAFCLHAHTVPALSWPPAALYIQNNPMGVNLSAWTFPVNLTSLNVSGCQLQGTIPPGWDMSVYPLLSTLDLSNNSLQGSIPGSWLLANGSTVNLQLNSLTGGLARSQGRGPSGPWLAAPPYAARPSSAWARSPHMHPATCHACRHTAQLVQPECHQSLH